ncbi:MAG: hypothetical protein B7Z80_17560 [Rhodospirillales bacterium 20-64-7]|nr:MAG: hypothetical protein B7Z80_17560 [Rhodospirillales bacterium 20-64-7]
MGKIVWLASYPKSGNTWLRAFLHNYITKSESPHSIDALTDFSVPECAAAFFSGPGDTLSTEQVQRERPAAHEKLTRLHDDLVFVKTHNAHIALHGIPLCTPEHTAGAILIVRDPRDVALSYSAFLGKPLDEVIGFMANPRAANRGTPSQVFEFLSSWSLHAQSWTQANNLLVIRYEDLLAEAAQHFGRIIHFLGGDPEPERLASAIEFSRFDALAQQELKNGYRAGGPGHTR